MSYGTLSHAQVLFGCNKNLLQEGENGMRGKRWIYVTGVVFMALMSCSLNICGYRQGYEREQLSDSAWIAQSGDTYTYWHREGNILPDRAELQFSRFFGKETLWTIEVHQEGSLHIASTIKSPQGPFAVVLVQSSTKDVLYLAKRQGFSEKGYYLKKGTYTLKILGYDASGSVAITLSCPSGITSKVSTMSF